jgi:manganese transport protein
MRDSRLSTTGRRLPEPGSGRATVPASTSGTLAAAGEVFAGKRRGMRALLPFLGPAFVASVAYVDPGNFATNIQGGAQYGYMLLWVIVASNLMAMLIQVLSAKLGIATGRNLAETCRDRLPPPVVWSMWGISEIVAMATDLAEFLGAAIGLNLLFGLPLPVAGVVTAAATLLILGLQQYGFRPLEVVIGGFVGIIAAGYLIELLLGAPDWGEIAIHSVTPQFAGTESVLLAVGILGATVMPHVVFLHSSLTQHRVRPANEAQARRLLRYEVLDVVVAMGLAGLINGAMLVMAASTFNATGNSQVATIEEAHRTLTPLLGGASSTIFALSLLASGLSSSAVGTMAGQVIMQGFLRRRISLWLRRTVTMLPALVVIALGLDPTRTLVISQVVLSFGIPFALIPLVIFTRRRDLMGKLANSTPTTVVVSIVAALIVALNAFLLYRTFFWHE